MNYKTKIKIAIIVGVIFIIIMFIAMVAFVKNNDNSTVASSEKNVSSENQVSTSNTENSTENNVNDNQNDNTEMSIEDICSFGIQRKDDGNYLMQIYNDLTSKSVINLSEKENWECLEYDYSDGKLYLIYIGIQNLQIYSLDLSNMEKTLIVELEDDFLNSFTFYNGDIYYVTTRNSIYKYNIENKEGKDIIILNENETIENAKLDKNNGILYFMKNTMTNGNYIANVCKLNLSTNEQETIINADAQGQEILLKDNYLICNIFSITEEQVDENNFEEVRYSINYVYNIETNSLWELGNIKLTEVLEMAYGNVAFSRDYIAFSDGAKIKIVDYDGNIINDTLYEAEEGKRILDIYMISDNSLQIRVGETEDDVSETYIIDFNTDTIREVSKNYFDILNIK